MANPSDRHPAEPTFSGLTGSGVVTGVHDHDPTRLRPPPETSRVDTLPEDFLKLLGQTKKPAVGMAIGGRYKLIERLGSGAMGDVFVAENVSIGAHVAVKLLKNELLTDASFRRRFQREAQAVAAITHPNVARFLDLVVGDPTFLVMEYVQGPTLAARIREMKRIPVERAVPIAVRLCWALRAAHAVGVIHRDLKPANVVLTADVEHDELPKLIDFGLAKLTPTASEGGRANSSLTQSGQLVGTPQYMSPEQIAGKNVDPRSDIYALGCVLYEMLTGRAPFAGDDDFQILYKQVNEPTEPLRRYAPEVPPALEAVVMRALAKRPEDRFGTMPELAHALESSLWGDHAGTVRRDSASLRTPEMAHALAQKKRQRTARNVIMIALAVIALGFAGGFAASRLGRARRAPGGLFVLSDPPGALVEVDGKPLPQTTPTLATDLTPGPHTIKLQRVGTAAVTQSVTLKANERATVQVTLPAASHRVDVRSVPDGAQVFLDGRLMLGETPTSVEITDEDFHELRIEKIGFEPLIRPLTPDDKAPVVSLTLVPEKAPRGALMIDANNSAEVWIDGNNTGYTTPTLAITVAAGSHTVEVRDANGQKSQPTPVVVEPGQTVRLLLGAK
jgi:tRNA A-37 threonylcarbamoyl transferase component Bud32